MKEMKPGVFFNWSGGKDSALALHKVMESGAVTIQCLLTNMNTVHGRVSMHGVRRSLVEAQAAAIGLPLRLVELPEQPTMEVYEAAMLQQVQALKAAGCSQAIFGDIFLEDLKTYREQKLQQAGVDCVFPLWKMNTAELMNEFISLGFKALVVCVNERWLNSSFCGREIDAAFINDLPRGVDICGENGEYHSFVYDGPIFQKPVAFKKGKMVRRQYEAPGNGDSVGSYGFWFCDLEILGN